MWHTVEFAQKFCAAMRCYASRCHKLQSAALALLFYCLATSAPLARANEAEWIWSPAYEKELAPAGTCFFRKTFKLGTPENGEIQLAAQDRYELFVNGRAVGTGENWKVLDVHDITKYLVAGNNTIAIKATVAAPGAAGLVARVTVKEQGGTHIAHSTGASWKTTLKESLGWHKPKYDDSQWLPARSFGALGMTLPWGNEVTVAGSAGRFKVPADFRVEWIIDAKETGSLISMAFDEFGQIIASREQGPLLLVRDDNNDGLLDTVSTLCDKVKNCQGILAVSGRVFVVGEGPQGLAMYRLTDTDQDGRIDEVTPILKFTGEVSEHGPHSIVLGPDGLIYMVVGNFSHVDKAVEATSPYHHVYEGDLLQPRYEDASGHAVGVKAPGGTILRTDMNGSSVELVAGGLQNPYDIAFNREGALFTCDSDMEWDSGMSWYRPTRVNHVVAGAEFGWRSGWAKWPDYFLDSLPPALETGRGSPTGMEVYSHFMYPARYHNAVFACDWSRGRILAIKTKQHGATYKATSDVFVEGRPLNVTDIAVGPDGWLYFCTGGRETEGGIHRVVWSGNVPDKIKDLGTGLTAALRQPQLQSAWARQQVALVKQKLGKQWDKQLIELVDSTTATAEERARGLDLMQLFGPYPAPQHLVKLSKDKQSILRAKAAYMMGIHADATTGARLVALLSDADLNVQRTACESLVRSGYETPYAKLLPLLGSSDRHVAYAARRALERVPSAQWAEDVIGAEQTRQFLVGSIALLVMNPDDNTIDGIVTRASELMKGYLNDQDFLDLLRVTQLALLHGKLKGENIPGLRQQLAEEYPTQDDRMNRELVRLLAYVQEPTAAARFVAELRGEASPVDKMHVAVHARFLTAGWTTDLKLELLKFYEDARALPGGHSFAGYIENVSRDFFAGFSEEERQLVLADGAKWPTSALSVLAKMPPNPSSETLAQIQILDRQLKRVDSEAARRLRIGIVAVLASTGDEPSMAYLRELFESEPDRRVSVAMGLAQQPDGENWPLLVRALSIVEGSAAQEVLLKLAQVDRKPDKPEAYRQAIIRGLMIGDNGAPAAIALLEKWTGEKQGEAEKTWQAKLAAWQLWFAQMHPDEPEAKLPVESQQNNWTYQELLSYLTGPSALQGSSERGAAIFEKAQCQKCHRAGDRGETIGPDLTTVAQRFQKKEILESVLFPSQVVSDQYASQLIVTKSGRNLTGLVAPRGDGSITVLQANGEKVVVAADDVESRRRSKQSSMPEGLLNTLSLEEIADLFTFLAKPATGELTAKPGTKTK